MSDKIEDDDLGLDDDEFGDFDDFDDFGDAGTAEAPPKNAREAAARSLTKTGSSFVDDFTEDKTETVKEIAKAAIPDALSSQASIAVDMHDTVKDEVSGALQSVRKEANNTFRMVKKLIPENSDKMQGILNKIGDVLGLEESTGGNSGPSKEQLQLESIKSEISSAMGENKNIDERKQLLQDQISQNRHKTQSELASMTVSNLDRIRTFNYEITNTYYRKNLEIQLKSLYTQKETLEVTKAGFDIFKNQFESIIRNTSLPDIVKSRNSEVLVQQMKLRTIDNITTGVLNSGPLGAFKKNVKEKVEEYKDRAIEGLQGANQGLEMATSEDTGMDKETMLATLLAGYVKEKAGKKLGKMFSKSELGRETISKVAQHGTDVSGFFKTKAGESDGGMMGTLFSALSDMTANAPRKNYTLQKQDLNDVKEMDKRFHSSIVKVIPGLLSKIYGEIKSIRTKDGKPKDNELYYNHDTDSFNNKTEMVAGVNKIFKNSLNKTAGVNLDTMLKIIMNLGNTSFSSREINVIRTAITRHLMKKGGASFAGLKKMKLEPTNLLARFRNALKYIDTMSRKAKGSEAFISGIKTINESLKTYLGNLSGLGMEKEMTNLSEMGYGDIIKETGIMTTDAYSGNFKLDKDNLDAKILNGVGRLSNKEINIAVEEEAKRKEAEKEASKNNKYTGGYVEGYAKGGFVKGRRKTPQELKEEVANLRVSKNRYTGDGGKRKVAGIVHKGEYVFNKDNTIQAIKNLATDNTQAMKTMFVDMTKNVKAYTKDKNVKDIATDALSKTKQLGGDVKVVLTDSYKEISKHIISLSGSITKGLNDTLTNSKTLINTSLKSISDTAVSYSNSMLTKITDSSIYKDSKAYIDNNETITKGKDYITNGYKSTSESLTNKYEDIKKNGFGKVATTDAANIIEKGFSGYHIKALRKIHKRSYGKISWDEFLVKHSIKLMGKYQLKETKDGLMDKGGIFVSGIKNLTAKDAKDKLYSGMTYVRDSKTGKYVESKVKDGVTYVKNSKTGKYVESKIKDGVTYVKNSKTGKFTKSKADSALKFVKDANVGKYVTEKVDAGTKKAAMMVEAKLDKKTLRKLKKRYGVAKMEDETLAWESYLMTAGASYLINNNIRSNAASVSSKTVNGYNASMGFMGNLKSKLDERYKDMKEDSKIEYVSKLIDLKPEEVDKLRLEFFGSDEYKNGDITDFHKWLRRSKQIDTGTIQNRLSGLMSVLNSKFNPLSKMRTTIDKYKEEAYQEVIGKITGTGLKELTLDEESSLREEYYKSKEKKAGLVTDFDEWLKTHGFRRNGTGLFGRMKKAFSIKNILKKTRKFDSMVGGFALKMAGKGLKHAVKSPWYALKGSANLAGKLGRGAMRKTGLGGFVRDASEEKKAGLLGRAAAMPFKLGAGLVGHALGGVGSAFNTIVPGAVGMSLKPSDMKRNGVRIKNAVSSAGINEYDDVKGKTTGEKLTETIADLVKTVKTMKEPKKPKQSVFDRDGDGDRDGNWKDRLKSFGRKKIIKAKILKRKVGKGISGIMGMLGKFLPLLVGIMGFGKSMVGGLLGLGGTIAKALFTAKPIKLLFSALTSLPTIIGGIGKSILGLGSIIGGMGKTLATLGTTIVSGMSTAMSKVVTAIKPKVKAPPKPGVDTKTNKAKVSPKDKVKVTPKSKVKLDAKSKDIISKLNSFVNRVKGKVLKKFGPKAGGIVLAKLSAKVAARFVPVVGQALLAYSVVDIGLNMAKGHDLDSAISLHLIGVDVFADDAVIKDSDGNPIKPDTTTKEEKEDKKIEEFFYKNIKTEKQTKPIDKPVNNRDYSKPSYDLRTSLASIKPLNNRLYDSTEGDGANKEQIVKGVKTGSVPNPTNGRGSPVDPAGGFSNLILGKGVRTDGFKPSFAKHLASMANEYYTLTGKKLPINSGYRSYADQLALKRKYGKKAASPGKSMHEFGLAFDTNTSVANELDKLGLMRKYGFTRPVGKETWHVESAGSQLGIDISKRDPVTADQLVATSLGRGGLGWGTVTNARKYSRNKKYQQQLLTLPSETTSNDNKQTTPDFSMLNKLPKQNLPGVKSVISSKTISNSDVKEMKLSTETTVDVEKKPSGASRSRGKVTSKATSRPNNRRGRHSVTKKENKPLVDKHQKELAIASAKTATATNDSVKVQKEMLSVLGDISKVLGKGLDINNLKDLPQPVVNVTNEGSTVVQTERNKSLPEPTIGIKRKRYAS